MSEIGPSSEKQVDTCSTRGHPSLSPRKLWRYFHYFSHLIGCFISISRHFPLAWPSARPCAVKNNYNIPGEMRRATAVDSGRKLFQLRQEVQILLFEKKNASDESSLDPSSGNGCCSKKDRMWVYSWNNKQILLPHFGPLTFTHTPSPTSLFSSSKCSVCWTRKEGKNEEKWRPNDKKNLLVHRPRFTHEQADENAHHPPEM